VDRRWLLALMPMLIGMLPMAGGALFSAPMVQEASQDLEVSPERRTFLNYWFRHSLESVFPLYPSLVLAAGLMEVPVQTLTRTQFPLFVAMLVSGILFGLLGIPRAVDQGDRRPARRETLVLLSKSIWPIALVLGLALLVGMDLILSLLLTLAALVAVHRLGPRQVWEAARGTSLSAVPILGLSHRLAPLRRRSDHERLRAVDLLRGAGGPAPFARPPLPGADARLFRGQLGGRVPPLAAGGPAGGAHGSPCGAGALTLAPELRFSFRRELGYNQSDDGYVLAVASVLRQAQGAHRGILGLSKGLPLACRQKC